jgi:hypothetical protein
VFTGTSWTIFTSISWAWLERGINLENLIGVKNQGHFFQKENQGHFNKEGHMSSYESLASFTSTLLHLGTWCSRALPEPFILVNYLQRSISLPFQQGISEAWFPIDPYVVPELNGCSPY